MKIIKINPEKPSSKVINQVAKVLKLGGVIVYPTDTCYGLGADITNPVAIKKIYLIKGREKKALSMIIRSMEDIEKFAEVNKKQKDFMKRYFPGAVTFILLNLKYKNINMNTLAFRIPDYQITKKIMEKIEFPLTTTSANLSGKDVCYNVKDIVMQFKDRKIKPDLILDAGNISGKLPSTVVDLISWPPRVLRQGDVKIKI